MYIKNDAIWYKFYSLSNYLKFVTICISQYLNITETQMEIKLIHIQLIKISLKLLFGIQTNYLIMIAIWFEIQTALLGFIMHFMVTGPKSGFYLGHTSCVTLGWITWSKLQRLVFLALCNEGFFFFIWFYFIGE